MADEKFSSNGNVTVWAVPVASVADYRSPTAAEINGGLDITDAIAWENTTFPSATDSNDIDDRSLRDAGNATSRGFAQWEVALTLFRPKSVLDTTSDYGKAWQLFKTPRVPYYIITRVAQSPTGQAAPAVAGDWISVYRILTDAQADDTEGEDSYKYSFTGLAQGEVEVYTRVKLASVITVTSLAGTSPSVGDVVPMRATLGSQYMTQNVEWTTSDASLATVSPNGVVTCHAAGSVDISATHPAATGATTPVSLTIS
jgi:hypothetical protein